MGGKVLRKIKINKSKRVTIGRDKVLLEPGDEIVSRDSVTDDMHGYVAKSSGRFQTSKGVVEIERGDMIIDNSSKKKASAPARRKSTVSRSSRAVPSRASGRRFNH